MRLEQYLGPTCSRLLEGPPWLRGPGLPWPGGPHCRSILMSAPKQLEWGGGQTSSRPFPMTVASADPRPIWGLCPRRGKADAVRGRLGRGCMTVS